MQGCGGCARIVASIVGRSEVAARSSGQLSTFMLPSISVTWPATILCQQRRKGSAYIFDLDSLIFQLFSLKSGRSIPSCSVDECEMQISD